MRISASTSVPFGPTTVHMPILAPIETKRITLLLATEAKSLPTALTKGREKDIMVVLARGKSGGEVEPNPSRTAKSVHAPVTIVA